MTHGQRGTRRMSERDKAEQEHVIQAQGAAASSPAWEVAEQPAGKRQMRHDLPTGSASRRRGTLWAPPPPANGQHLLKALDAYERYLPSGPVLLEQPTVDIVRTGVRREPRGEITSESEVGVFRPPDRSEHAYTCDKIPHLWNRRFAALMLFYVQIPILPSKAFELLYGAVNGNTPKVAAAVGTSNPVATSARLVELNANSIL